MGKITDKKLGSGEPPLSPNGRKVTVPHCRAFIYALFKLKSHCDTPLSTAWLVLELLFSGQNWPRVLFAFALHM